MMPPSWPRSGVACWCSRRWRRSVAPRVAPSSPPTRQWRSAPPSWSAAAWQKDDMSRVKQQIRDVVWPRRGIRGWAAWLVLQPATGLFATGVALRNLGYRIGLLHVHRAGIAVVSVGNLSVGGTGKTPITLWLAHQLAAHGARVAILLRGYRGHARAVTIVSKGAGPEVDVATAGDEAVMLAKGFRGPVLTARRRADGVAAAEQLGCDVVVLDDGFQHRALARDFDLVLLNGRSGGLLPAGPMREPASALERADAVAMV